MQEANGGGAGFAPGGSGESIFGAAWRGKKQGMNGDMGFS